MLDRGAVQESVVAVGSGVRQRIDWRTGKVTQCHDDAFWLRHEALRIEQGLTLQDYCAREGLSRSTFGRRLGRIRKRGGVPALPARPSVEAVHGGHFIDLRTPQRPIGEAESLEVEVGGLKLRLRGTAAERVVAGVLARLS